MQARRQSSAPARVDNLDGILSVLLVTGLVLAINFAPVPGKGTQTVGLAAVAVAFVLRQRRAASPLCRLDIAGLGCSGSPPSAGSSYSGR